MGEQRLVDDLQVRPALAARVLAFVLGQEPRVHERVQDHPGLGPLRLREDRQELLALAGRPRSLSGHQVPE
jgi:hypothetical protein